MSNEKRTFRPYWLVTVAVILVMVFAVAACTTTGTPSEAPAEAGEETTATGGDAETAEQEEDANTVTVQQSQAAQGQVVGGVEVVSDEDVTTPRTNRGGEYRSTSSSDIVNFHPYLTTDTASGSAQGNVWDSGLLRLDPDTLQYIPNMAESYTISEDGLTYTFKLRQNMQWSDGTPITAHDFAWSYEQAVNPVNEYPYASQLTAFITEYTALDDYTLQIKIDQVYCPALGQMSGLITPLPKHIWENLDWKDPEKNPEINKPSVISGPYHLVEWARDQYTIYEANENYWYHGAPNISRIVTTIVPDNDISYQMMKNGEADTGVITPQNLEEARSLENITVYEWWPAAAAWSYVGLNMREGFVTHDINVRHGLSYAINKDDVIAIMEGQARRQCSVWPETSWVYNPDVPCYDYDPEQAIAEFEKSGYTFDGTTMRTPDGEPLTLNLIYGPHTSTVRRDMAVVIQDNLKDIGIQVEIQALEWASFLAATDAEEPTWDMFIGAWSSTIEPHIMFTIWAEENIPSLNSVAYINKEVEALFAEAGRNCDIEFRKEKYGEIQRIIAEESPYIFLFYQKTWSGQNKRVQGIDPKPLGIGWNFNDWYIQEVP